MGKSKRESSSESAPSLKKKRSERVVELNSAFQEHIEDIGQAVRNRTAINTEVARVYPSPFVCCSLKNFLASGDSFIADLRAEVESLPFDVRINDLYSFQQTDDIRRCPGQCLAAFRSLLCTQVLDFLRQSTGINLSERVDATCSKYEVQDTLLCHDDELDCRRIAFIYYLMPEWGASDGGCLDLFTVDEHGQPDSVVESIVPHPNMFVFFPVTLDSFHQVAEVLSPDKTRLSISGWFYGESFPRPPPYMEPELPLVAPLDGIDIRDWINPIYFKPAVQAKIRKSFERRSEAELHSFLKPKKYEQVRAVLESDQTHWSMQGPANKRHFEVCEPDASGVLKTCIDVLSSQAVFSLLSKLTGMNLSEDRSVVPLPMPIAAAVAASGDAPTTASAATSSAAEAGGEDSSGNAGDEMLMCVDESDQSDGEQCEPEEDEDAEDEDEDAEDEDDDADDEDEDAPLGNPTVQAAVCHWSPGCYTLMHDLETQCSGMSLDARLFLSADDWEVHCGGFTCYFAKGEDEELLRIQPSTNSLALVCRDSDTLRFVKYISRAHSRQTQENSNGDTPQPAATSARPPTASSFYDISLVYRE